MVKYNFEMIEGKMKKVSIRYKVLSSDRKSLLSIFDDIIINISSLFLIYEKDKLIKPIPNSFGIFVFDTFENAKNYTTHFKSDNLIILKVKAIGKPSFRKSILNLEGLERFAILHKIRNNDKIWYSPRGTEIYKEGVIPLE